MTAGPVVLVGTTASGKSGVALEVARRLGDVEILSVDSMSVYRELDIGTAKPTAAVRAEIPHHLVDLVDPAEEFTVAQFQRAATAALAVVAERRHRPLLVGGTGLYVRSVVDDLDLPGRWPAVRAELEADAGSPDRLAALHARLRRLDPVAAARTTATNERRIVRALEVTLGSGRPFSSFGPGLESYPPTRFTLIGLRFLPAPVDQEIEARVADWLAAGWLEEVRRLVARPAGLSRTARQALGYQELLAHLEGSISLDEAVEAAVRRTRSFARRQWAWFRRDPRVHWVDSRREATDAVAAALRVG
ncbi:MAG TPA: tRNA (adenosine(37)-N6)-dimethylallyltransferase MiaA [Acidimicrobiales bacterium]|nr:tRNA (adenosine(37)-N6)-dimethylallyltransferase MiaA [Acidimicrobiales bacterium]